MNTHNTLKEIAAYSALSCLNVGIAEIEANSRFNFAFFKAYDTCELNKIYPNSHMPLLNQPNGIIEMSENHPLYDITPARWKTRLEKKENTTHNFYIPVFSYEIDSDKLEEGTDPKEIILQIIAETTYGIDISTFSKWEKFGAIFRDTYDSCGGKISIFKNSQTAREIVKGPLPKN